ncbi:MAG: single- stranded DNA-binding family protein, partial [Pyrobaculum sp.]
EGVKGGYIREDWKGELVDYIYERKQQEGEIVRATSELNKKIYEALISMGVGKLDIVRITVEAAVEGGRLMFGEPKIEWFVPHSEMQKRLEECEKRIAEIRKRIESLLKEIP